MTRTKQLAFTTLVLLALPQTAPAQYPGWQRSGSIYLLTTPDGANLPATATEESSGAAVFNADNGFHSVLHLDEAIKDEAGAAALTNKGTTTGAGVIGKGLHVAAGQLLGLILRNTISSSSGSNHDSNVSPGEASARFMGTVRRRLASNVITIVGLSHHDCDVGQSNETFSAFALAGLPKDGLTHRVRHGGWDLINLTRSGRQ